jgi:hypothetical protein
MALLAGRDFNFRDVERPPVAIVNQTMARRYFPGGDPIGKPVAIDPDPKNGTWFGTHQPYEIVGLVGPGIDCRDRRRRDFLRHGT